VVRRNPTDASAICVNSIGELAMDWESEQLLVLKDACRLVPGRTGKGISVSTLWRWIQIGCSGIKLESIVVGRQRYVNRESLRRFVLAINDRSASANVENDARIPIESVRDDVDRQLRAEGL
jgi:hypothetical protein